MMRIAYRRAWVAGVLAVILSATGCPLWGPKLVVSPQAISLGDAGTETAIQIRNTGSGTLVWHIQEDIPWLTISGAAEGTNTTTGVSAVDLRITRAGLNPGPYSGVLNVISNGGTHEVRISIQVTSPATISVNPDTIDLGTTGTTSSFTITNAGSEDLTWSLQVPTAAGWLTASPTSGKLSTGQKTIQVQAKREGLSAGLHEANIALSSNAGAATVHVALTVPPRQLIVAPLQLDFGTSSIEQTFNVSNGGPETLTWRVDTTAANFPAYVTVLPANGTTTSETDPVLVRINRAAMGFAYDTHNQVPITVTSDDNGGTATVTLLISVGAFSLSPTLLEFGADNTQLPIVLTNHSDDPITWTTAKEGAWISAITPSGTTPAGGTANINVTIDRQGLEPDTYTGAFTVSSGEQTDTVSVTMVVPPPPQLVATPNLMDFGDNLTDKVLALWNGGIGTVNWHIDPAGLPAWASLTLAGNPGAPLQGALTGQNTHSVRVSVNRAGLAPGLRTTQFTVTATDQDGAALASQVINLRMNVAAQPVLAVETSDATGALAFGADLTSGVLRLRNLGTGSLEWSIATANLPAWLSITPTPLQGVIENNETVRELSVTVNRDALSSGDYEHLLAIQSNGGNASIRISLTVPQPVMKLDPATLDLGNAQTNAEVSITNTGGGSFTWKAEVPSEFSWLKINPATGTVTTSTPGSITITVDRSTVDHGDHEGYVEFKWGSNVTRLNVLMTVDGPKLSVTPQSLIYGPAEVQQIVTVENNGDRARILTWNVSQLPLPWASVDTRVGTTLTEADPVRLTVDRSGMLQGQYSGDLVFSSNGGEKTIPVTLNVGALSVDPVSVEIDSSQDTATFRIENHSSAAIAWTAADSVAWLGLNPASGAIPVGGRATVTLSANRTGLAPGWYETSVTVAAPAAGYTQPVPVRMRVASFELIPETVDAGVIDTQTQSSFRVRNIGAGELTWTAAVAENAPWLTLGVSGEQQTPESGETEVALTLNPSGLIPGDYTGIVTITSGSDQDTLTVTMTVPAPPALAVSPSSLNFGTALTDKLLAIWNSGTGTVQWAIDTTGFPAWLSVAQTSGTVPNNTADTSAVLVSIDRSGITPPATLNHTFTITGRDQNSAVLTPRHVTVSMAVAATPVLTLETVPAVWDANAKPLMTLGETAQSGEFVISNTGTGVLNWSINAASLPAWLTIPGSLQGSLGTPGAQASLQVNVNRTGLASGDHSHEIAVSSNGGEGTVRVVITVPDPVLTLSPTSLSFGEDETAKTFSLENTGGDILEWTITLPSDAPWINIETTEGVLTVGSPIEIPLTVDRSGLGPGEYTGNVTINSNGGNKTLAVTMIVPGPQLVVAPGTLIFNILNNERTVESVKTLQVQNRGDSSQTLTWSIDAGYAHWLRFDTLAGATTSENTVTVTASRTGLAAGVYQTAITFRSNGGVTPVLVTLYVPAFTLTPTSVEIGARSTTTSFTLENHGTAALNWTSAIDWPQWTNPAVTGWLSVTPGSGLVAARSRSTLALTVANRNGLAPGTHEGPVVIQAPATGFAQQLNASVDVAAFNLELEPGETLLDFGELSGPAQAAVTLRNIGNASVSWQASIVSGAPWLTLPLASSGVVPGGATTPVTVQANPNGLTPGVYIGSLQVSDGTDTDTVSVRMSVPMPPFLAAAPLAINFGTLTLERTVAIWNSGIGTVNWNVDASEFPAWLSIAGPSQGSVSGATTDILTLRVDRTTVPPSDVPYRHTFDITATDGNSNPLEPMTIDIRVNVVGIPILEIQADGVDQSNVPFVNLGTADTQSNFIIRNTGTGALQWTINTAGMPAWITGITPTQGSTAPGRQTSIMITIDRTGLSYGGYQQQFIIETNDLDNRTAPISIQMQVPKRAIIGLRPTEIDVDLNANSTSFEVCNSGDPGSVLDFYLESNKDWLFFYPATGSSVGVSGDVKDWQEIGASIDRTRLESTGSTATVTIHAYRLDEQLNRVTMDDEVPPVTLPITVVAAPLSFEVASANTRIPSLLRFPMILRNVQYRTIELPEDQLAAYANQFTVYEKDTPLEFQETNQFLTSGKRLRTNIVLLLDYSGSMYAAANLIEEDPAFDAFEVAHPGDPLDKLQAIYEYYLEQLVREMPDNYRIAVMEFHDREHPVVTRPTLVYRLTKNKDVVVDQIRSINVQDHGATELLPELMSASDYLSTADFPYIPFDSADVSALILISDGRLTTPPGKVKDAYDWLALQRTRLFAIGWGSDVNHEPLARIASATGGHYYPTRMEAQYDNQGNPIYDDDGEILLLPTTAQLADYCAYTGDPCDQSVAHDLQSQVVFSYASLNEEANIKTRIVAGFDDPNDDFGACGLEDQYTIFGNFEQKLFFDTIVGDGNLGQISMHTDGIQPDRTADVLIRADYIPRNISEFEMTFTSTRAFSIEFVGQDDGGIIWDWTPEPAAGTANTRTLHVASVDATPLRYAEFGDLFKLHFENVTTAFNLNLEVNNDLYVDNEWPYEDKYFIYPNAIEINVDGRIAPAFPTPLFTRIRPVHANDVYNTIHLNTTDDQLEFSIENIGGTFPYGSNPSIYLKWSIASLPAWLTLPLGANDTGYLTNGVGDVDNIVLNVDRSAAPGDYYGEIIVEFSHYYGGGTAKIYVWQTILPPEAYLAENDPPAYTELDPRVIDFGAASSTESFVIMNSGQSTLNWTLAPADGSDALPDWMVVSAQTGTLKYDTNGVDDRTTINVTLNRITAPEGAFSETLRFVAVDERGELITMESGEAASVDIELRGTIQPPAITVNPTTLNFGDDVTGVNQMTSSVTNTGDGILYWEVDTTGLPAWMTVSQPTPQTRLLASSSPAGTFRVTIDRTTAPAAINQVIRVYGRKGSSTGALVNPAAGVAVTISGTN